MLYYRHYCINKGDIYGFTGKNGAGKTTFMRTVLSLTKPDEGEIKLFGNKSIEEVGLKIGSLIESPGLYKNASAIENFLSSEVEIVSIIFIALFSCLDFNEGTTKNIIARGYTRTQLLLTKYIATLIGLSMMYIATIVLTFILFAKNGLGYESNMLYLFINSIIGIIANTVFYVTMAFLLEKNGSAIIACLFVPNLIPMLLSLIDSKLKLSIGDYWLDSASIKFVNNPTLQNLLWSIVYYIIYIIVFIVIGTQLLNKKEI